MDIDYAHNLIESMLCQIAAIIKAQMEVTRY